MPFDLLVAMSQYILLLTVIGLATFAMAWMPAITKRTGVSYSILYVFLGVLAYIMFPEALPVPLPQKYPEASLHLAELVVIISLMGTGIKIDRSFSRKKWASPLKLVSFAMLICIAVAGLLGFYFLGLNLGAAILLGAVLAPTDPVLASDVQVGPPNEGSKSETRFALTAEAGMNDGMAFPFTWLAITIVLMATGEDTNLWKWFAVDFVYKIVAGFLIGLILGRIAGWLVFSLSQKFAFLKTNDGFLAISLTLLVYGITEIAHAYGFIAVFVAAISLRHYEKGHEYHDQLHSFTDQAERILIAVLLILFGGALVSGILKELTWQMVLFSLGFLFVIRPLAAYISLYNANIHIKEKLAISFFGIRGMGSIYYLAFAFQEVRFLHQDELWSIVSFTILISIIIHGMTATSIMNYLNQEMPKEKIPQ